MNRHVLKTIGTVWDAVAEGHKRFEVRKNDRFFQAGDTVVLRKLDIDGRHYASAPGGGMFSTCDLEFRIGWILQGGQFGIDSAYCVFQLEPMEAAKATTPGTDAVRAGLDTDSMEREHHSSTLPSALDAEADARNQHALDRSGTSFRAAADGDYATENGSQYPVRTDAVREVGRTAPADALGRNSTPQAGAEL